MIVPHFNLSPELSELKADTSKPPKKYDTMIPDTKPRALITSLREKILEVGFVVLRFAFLS